MTPALEPLIGPVEASTPAPAPFSVPGPRKGIVGRVDAGRLSSIAALFATAIIMIQSTALFLNYVSPFENGHALEAADNVFQTTIPLVAALACVAAATDSRGRARWGWGLLGMATLSWAMGQAVWTVYESVLGEAVPFPGWADVGYLGFVVFAAAGMLMFPMAPRQTGQLGRMLIDGGVIASSLFFVSWALVLGPLYRAGEGSAFEQAIGLAYPLGDVVILTLIMLVLAHARGGNRAPVALLGAGLFAFSVADTGFALLNLEGTYVSGHPIDLGWPIGFLLIALAAMIRRRGFDDTNHVDGPSSFTAALVPNAPLMLGVGTAVYTVSTVGHLEAFLVWCAAVCVTLVSLRQLWTIHDDIKLNRNLDRALKSKIDMLGHISHEMRNPLTPIQLQLHLLRIQGPEPLSPGRERSLVILERNFQRLNLFIQDVLDVARLEAGRLKITRGAVDMAQLIQDAVAASQTICDAKKIRLTTDVPNSLWAWGDPQRLAQVLANLTSNAVKYTPEAGAILVGARTELDRVVVYVRDEGIGLSPEQVRKLFQPFGRAHESIGVPGLGLGLYICKGIVDQHGGRIWAESDGPGLGATFSFTVPASAPQRAGVFTSSPSPARGSGASQAL